MGPLINTEDLISRRARIFVLLIFYKKHGRCASCCSLNEEALQFFENIRGCEIALTRGRNFQRKQVSSFEKTSLGSLKTVIIMHAAIHTRAVDIPGVAEINCEFSLAQPTRRGILRAVALSHISRISDAVTISCFHRRFLYKYIAASFVDSLYVSSIFLFSFRAMFRILLKLRCARCNTHAYMCARSLIHRSRVQRAARQFDIRNFLMTLASAKQFPVYGREIKLIMKFGKAKSSYSWEQIFEKFTQANLYRKHGLSERRSHLQGWQLSLY